MSNILTNLMKETSPSRLLRILSTDFLALRLVCFNIHHHGCQILYFKLYLDGRKFHYRSLHATMAAACVCTVGLDQGFPTFLTSRTTWAPGIVNSYHLFQKK